MPAILRRRDFLARSATALLGAGVLPGVANCREVTVPAGDFDFIAVNDLHFTDPRLCPPWFEQAFAAMRVSAPRAEFVLVSGDLSTSGTDLEFGGLKALFPQLKLPVWLTPGNHDVTRTGDYSIYARHFPGAVNYSFEHRGWQIVCFNSAGSRQAENTKVPQETLLWLDNHLKRLDPRKPTILSTHFPLGYGLVRRPKNTDAVLRRFANFNVRSIFNGHWHGFSQTLYHNAVVSTDRCCSRYRKNHDDSPEKGWFVCQARQGIITRRFVTIPAALI